MAQDISIRGQEVSVQVVVNGVIKGGSFARMESFSATPRTDLKDNDYLGEELSVPDLQHSGWDFTMEIREVKRDVFDLLNQILSAEKASQAHPNVNIVVTTIYRGVGDTSVSYTLEAAVIKCDSFPNVSGRTEYVKSTWSGKCREVRET